MERNRLYVVIAAALLAVGAAAILLNRGRSNGAFSVASADGVLKLEFSARALPDGMSPDDLAVEKVSAVDAEGSDWDVYELHPDGTIFREPVIVTADAPITYDEVGNALLPYVRHVSGGAEGGEAVGADPVDMEARLDLGTSRMNVRTNILHFSKIWISKESGQLAVSISPPPPAEIGKPVAIPVRITAAKQAEPIFGPDHYADPRFSKVQVVSPILYTTLEGAFEEKVKPQILSPVKTVFDKPAPGTKVGPGDVVTFTSTDFTCEKQGKTSLEWYSFYNAYTEPNDWWSWKMWINIPIECVEKPVAAKQCSEYEGGYLKERGECVAGCEAQNAKNTGVARLGTCHCVPVDDAPGCFIACFGDECFDAE